MAHENLATLRLIINYLHLGFLKVLSLALFCSPYMSHQSLLSSLTGVLTSINMHTILNSSSLSLSHQLPPTFKYLNQHSLTYPSGSLLTALP